MPLLPAMIDRLVLVNVTRGQEGELRYEICHTSSLSALAPSWSPNKFRALIYREHLYLKAGGGYSWPSDGSVPEALNGKLGERDLVFYREPGIAAWGWRPGQPGAYLDQSGLWFEFPEGNKKGSAGGLYFIPREEWGSLDGTTLPLHSLDQSFPDPGVALLSWEGTGRCFPREEAAAMKKKDAVDAPPHYDTKSGRQIIDMIEDLGWDADFCRGNALKYLARAGKKDPSKEVEDLRKAAWYIDRLISSLEARQ